MSAAKLTSKGQITLPKDIRERLGLKVGDRVAFRGLADGTVVLEPETFDLRALRGVVKTLVSGVSIDDMNRVVRRKGSGK